MNIAVIGASSESIYPLTLISRERERERESNSMWASAKNSHFTHGIHSSPSTFKEDLPGKNFCVSFAFDGNANAIGLKYATHKIICDIGDKSVLLEQIKKNKIDCILPVPVGRIIENIGFVNEALGLKGIKHEPARLCADKYEFALKLKGLRDAKTILLNKENISALKWQDLKNSSKIIKPRFGSGSRDIFVVSSQKELENALKIIENSNEDFIIEDMILGDEYGVSASVINGVFHLVLLRKKILTPLPKRQSVANIAVTSSEFYELVEKNLSQICKILGLNDCLLNADIIIKNNEVFVIEMAPRPSGHNIQSAFLPRVCGINFYLEYLNFLKGKEYNFSPKERKELLIGYFDLKGQITNIPNINELKKLGIVAYQCNFKKGDILGEVKDGHSIIPRGYFILGGGNLDEKRLELLARFQKEI